MTRYCRCCGCPTDGPERRCYQCRGGTFDYAMNSAHFAWVRKVKSLFPTFKDVAEPKGILRVCLCGKEFLALRKKDYACAECHSTTEPAAKGERLGGASL